MRLYLLLCLFSCSLAADVTETIAQVIYSGLPSYCDAYVKGIARALSTTEEATPQLEEEVHPFTLEWIAQARSNLAETERLLSRLSQNPAYEALQPGKLFVRTLKKGEGDVVQTTSDAIEVSLCIYKLEDSDLLTCVSALQQSTFHLNDIISGLAHGVVGMQVGETREVVIHPDFAYGYNSNFEPCCALVAKITLHSIHPGTSSLSPLIPLASIAECDHLDLEALLELAGFADGRRCYRHFADLPDHPPFTKVAQALQELHQGSLTLEPLDPDTAAMLHWEVQMNRLIAHASS
ncbi:MAG: FKBP-type peptidyl-prolyl cis-trans isomerase [Verrucomicrobia bacterium]|nr:FKBP-type peptidyl-prolyl cis-trans isomerase [Verrucomicrobiota bacterium]